MSQTFWLDRPVFVTGATGLLGSWTVKRLVELKADVVCLVRDWVPSSELVRSGHLERVKVVRGGLCDRDVIERTLGEYEIDTVLHLAAQTIVSIANRNPVSTFESNIGGTWAVLEASRRSPTVKQIVVASSDKAYGEHKKLPYAESAPLRGVHPYDVSKSCADLIAQSYAKTYGLPVAVTRCGNLFGGGDLNWNRVVPGTIRSVIRGNRPVIRSDGKYVRDYFYVEDAVDAVLGLVNHLAAGTFHRRPARTTEGRAWDAELTAEWTQRRPVNIRGGAFNFSNEEPLTVIAIVQKILKLMESPLKPVIQNAAQNEIRRQYLSAAKARRMLGWRPSVGIEEGLKRTITWYRDFFKD